MLFDEHGYDNKNVTYDEEKSEKKINKSSVKHSMTVDSCL